MAFRFLQGIIENPRVAQYSIGILGSCVCGGYLLPNGVFLHKYKNFAQAYKDGQPVRFSDSLRVHVNAVLDDVRVEQEERQLLRFFTAFGADLFHAGDTSMRWGAVLGLPRTFGLTSGKEMDSNGFQVHGRKVDWESREGRQLERALCLSPAAQRFAIALELQSVRGGQIWVDAGLASAWFFFTYLLGNSIKRRMGFESKPKALRVMLYGLVSLFGLSLWITSKDLLQNYRDQRDDKAAAQLGETYAWGGVEFYEKTLERNRALRALNPAVGERFYTVYGNERTVMRTPRMPLTERLETLRELCQRQYPRTEQEGA